MSVNINSIFPVLLFFFLAVTSCSASTNGDIQLQSEEKESAFPVATNVIVGAERMDKLLPLLKEKSLALVVNHSSRVGEVHLLDTLLALGMDVKKIFALEHGFRGDADAGALIDDGIDERTGLPVISLYGQSKKPQGTDLKDIDLVLFDIQDVGVRFYTYISSLHYIMEAAAENGVEVVVADRPNPNGFYIDGPILDEHFRSFVGMHPVPVVHGMTVAEYALMIVGEKWINQAENLILNVVTCLGYDHRMTYELPLRPSPNLPNLRSILLYPSLCFFEGTEVSVGRGTYLQFQLIGSPYSSIGDTTFIPKSLPGATQPPFLGRECRGFSFSGMDWENVAQKRQIDLSWLMKMYEGFEDKDKFFLRNNFIDRLAGTDQLRKQIKAGLSEEEIRASWQEGLEAFKLVRAQYLLYPDF
ncbi:MAG: DUF1343 domain-containing protein [Saprospirales bacterium]|nr:MAG: DUF1343 domain-containing protein [Saprospirales bacterium]